MKSKLNKEYKSRFTELRQIINSWGLIPDSPEDEFDSLNHLYLSQLYKGSDKTKIAKMTEFELTVNYGFSKGLFNVDEMTDKVHRWWSALG